MSEKSNEETATTSTPNEEPYAKIKSKVEILDVLFNPNADKTLINLGLINGKLKIYDLSKSKKRLVSVQKLHKKSIRKLAFAENSNHLLFTASKDKSIKLTDLNHASQDSVITIDQAHKAPINCLVAIDNWLIASADDNGAVKIWDYRKKDACMESETDCADYISDLAVSDDKKILLATCGEGTLSAFHTRKKKLVLQSELMDSEMLCIGFVKNGTKVVCGTGEGVVNIFNYDEWGNISDRFPGHPSSVDCLLPVGENVYLTGCFDGQIRACHLYPNRFLGIVGNHKDFPIQRLCLAPDGDVCASISHDDYVRFWNIASIKNKKLDAQSKSKSKSLKNKKLTSSGKADNFFSDLLENEDDSDEEKGSSGDDDSDDDSSQDDEDSDESSDDSD